MISTKRFANTESPINLDSLKEVGEENVLVLKNHRGEDVFIGVKEALKHARLYGMKDPFTAGATQYSPANAEILRTDKRTGDTLATWALVKAWEAGDAHDAGKLSDARTLLDVSLELCPHLPAALELQDILSALAAPSQAAAPHSPDTAGSASGSRVAPAQSSNASASHNRGAAAHSSATAGPSGWRRWFGGGRRAPRQQASTRLPLAARPSGVHPADLQALHALAQALNSDRSDGFVDSAVAVGEYIHQSAGHTPERLTAIDTTIKINGEPFSRALYAVFDPVRRVGGRRMGPDTLGLLLSNQLQTLGFPDANA